MQNAPLIGYEKCKCMSHVKRVHQVVNLNLFDLTLKRGRKKKNQLSKEGIGTNNDS